MKRVLTKYNGINICSFLQMKPFCRHVKRKANAVKMLEIYVVTYIIVIFILLFGFAAASAPVTAGVITMNSASVDYDSGIISVYGLVSGGGGSRVTLTIKNPDDIVINSFNSAISEGDGSFNFSVRPSQEIASGENNIYIMSTGAEQPLKATLTIDISKFEKPVIDNLQITGSGIVGEAVSVNYDYYHITGISEGDTLIQWMSADESTGIYEIISGASGKNYVLKSGDAYKYIKARVTGVASGFSNEVIKETPAIYAVIRPEVKDVSIEGSLKAGNIIVGTYTFYHPDSSVTEKNSVCKWKAASSINGIYTEIALGKSYLLTNNEAGKYIIFEATPKIEQEPFAGLTVSSSPVYIQAGQINTAGGGGYSGGGGGSAATIKVDEAYLENINEPFVFSDISYHWAKDDIMYMYERGMAEGTGADAFSPERFITRAEFSALAVRALSLPSAAYTNVFSDVKEDDWFSGIVQTALDKKLISGDDGLFRPDDNVTREEMTKIIIEAYKFKTGEALNTAENHFDDKNNISDWALDYVNQAVFLGFIQGTGENLFAPKNAATRAQALVVIKRLYMSFN